MNMNMNMIQYEYPSFASEMEGEFDGSGRGYLGRFSLLFKGDKGQSL